MRLPKPIKYTESEGGSWIKWEDRVPIQNELKRFGILAHSIVFDNGRAFDMVSGWRDGRNFKYDKKTGEKIT